VYWYKNINNKKVKFIGDEMVGNNPAEYFKSSNIESWGHKKDEDGTVDICFPEIWSDENWKDMDWWNNEDFYAKGDLDGE
jgi:hypothetical protein